MTPALHDPAEFFKNFVNELERRSWPKYPSKEWHGALARAVWADEAFRIARVHQEAFSCYDVAERRARRRATLELEAKLIGQAAGRWLRKRGLEYDLH